MVRTLRVNSTHPNKQFYQRMHIGNKTQRCWPFGNLLHANVKAPILLRVIGRRIVLFACKCDVVKKKNMYTKFRLD